MNDLDPEQENKSLTLIMSTIQNLATWETLHVSSFNKKD